MTDRHPLHRGALLVTGGCSGLGAAVVEHYAGASETVVHTFSRRAADAGGGAHHIRGDVRDAAALVAAAEGAAQSAERGLRATVHCAGVFQATSTAKDSLEHWCAANEDVVSVNVLGALNAVRASAEAMAKNDEDENGQRGVVLLVSSISARDGDRGAVAYTASKGAVEAATRPLAVELSTLAVRVVTISIGLFDAGMSEALPERVKTSLAKRFVLPNRMGRTTEFVQMVDNILDMPMLNGTVLRLDGALRL